jgi:hypothetical protein
LGDEKASADFLGPRLYTRYGPLGLLDRTKARLRKEPFRVKGSHGLASEAREQPEKEREHNADKQARDNRKVERGVLATVNDVSGKLSKAQRKLGSEVKQRTHKNEERPEDQKDAPKFTKGIHGEILS